MKLQFEKTVRPYLRTALWEPRDQEQTQEVKLPDGLPDIGTILGAWGQVLLRSKEWRGDGMLVSGGVMAWVLYAPEDGTAPRSLETWIPFQMKWDFPDTGRDGAMRVGAVVRSMDARTISARKMMLRAGISALGEAYVPGEAETFGPKEKPEDIELLRRTYPTRLPVEAGEKTFLLEEDLTLPASAPAVEKLVRFDMVPEMLDSKVMGGRMVFRGVGRLHILYQDPEGNLQSWDFETAFSQYTELDREYDQDAECTLVPAVTSLELEKTEEGSLHLKCGAVAQYVVFDRILVEIVEDAYSVRKAVAPAIQELTLPAVLEDRVEAFHPEGVMEVAGSRVVDVAFLPGLPTQSREAQQVTVTAGGSFRVLYYGESGALQSGTASWEVPLAMETGNDCRLRLWGQPVGRLQTTLGGGSLTVRADWNLRLQTVSQTGRAMVTELEIGEAEQPDPDRPSLILRRAGEESLWDIAKASGSTMAAIRQANAFQEEPEFGQLLLIPVC